MLSIDLDGLEEKVKPAIDDTIRDLEKAQDTISAIKIPEDFQYGGRLKSIPSDIADICSKLEEAKKWLEDCIQKFDNAENSNKNVLSVIGDILLSIMQIFGTNAQTAELQGEAGNSGGILDTVKQVISNVLNFGEDGISNVIDVAESTGAKVAEVGEFLYNNVIEPGWDIATATAASVANVVGGVLKGLGQFVESLVDVVVLGGTVAATVQTGLYDAGTYLESLIAGNEEDWESVTAKMWKGTMGYVAEDYVGNAFSSFYENTAVGQWLDENAFEVFKSEGVVPSIASGIGYVAGIVVLTLATFGVGGIAVGATGAGSTVASSLGAAAIAAAAGTGKYTQEAWGNMRDSSWQGIQEMYKNGDISQEQYTSLVMVRGLTDEQWSEITKDYQNGNITKEEYELMLQIRNMPDDWKTAGNAIKGLGYGVANGLWEGVQWYVGGKLAGWRYRRK